MLRLVLTSLYSTRQSTITVEKFRRNHSSNSTKKEENIKVEISIPQLGKSQATYIDELVAEENDDEETYRFSDIVERVLSDENLSNTPCHSPQK